MAGPEQAPQKRQFVNFLFYKVDPAWRNQRLKLTGATTLVFRASMFLLAAPAAWPER